ncbi:OmpA family protein [uncultured Polaribacter sp.]|uniref:OmpA family protein n=1 Tax=uncultured Polaribacter sp. TaxID=174711 RepID=UPI00261C1ADD|nr:OmpA family protein [uncultured Polaribacter sp.]
MSKKASYLLGIFITIVVGVILYYITDSHKFNTSYPSDKLEIANSSNIPKYPFLISDEKSGFKAEVADNFNFLTSDAAFIKPVSNGVLDVISKLKEQLLKNPSQVLDITGLFKVDETNTTDFENLGLARANSIKDFLISLGVSDKQLSTSFKLDNNLTADDNDIIYGPLAFNLVSSDDANCSLPNTDNASFDEAQIAAYKKLIGASFVINFDFARSSTKLTKLQKQKLKEICNAAKALGLKITVTGHTDSVGTNSSNYVLGKKRANFVKDQLLKSGGSDTEIQTSSKGENQPISSNTTEDGRSQNRRTVITIS